MGDEVTGSLNVGRRSVNGASTRDRLLDSAESVLVRQGSSTLTLDAVAAQAGVSKGGLLYHFPSKDALVAGLVERAVVRVDEALDKAAAVGGPGSFTRAYLDITMPERPEDAGDPLSAALVAVATVDPAHLAPLRAAYGRWQQRLENDGIAPAAATLVRLAVDGWWLSRVLGLPPIPRETLDKVRGALAQLATETAPMTKLGTLT